MAFDPDAFTKLLRSMGAPSNIFTPKSFVGLGPAPAAAAAPALGAAEAGAATGVARFAPTLTRSALMKGGGYATAGIIGGGLVNNLNVGGEASNTDRALTGAATGAGIGAGVGSVVPVIGTGVGALAGAGIGAAYNVFKPRKNAEKEAAKIDASTQKQLAALSAMTADLPEDVREALSSELLAGAAAEKAKLTTKSKDPVEAMAATLMAQIPQIQAQQRATERAEQERVSRATALQGSISSYMAPYLQRFVDTGEKSALQYEALGKPELAANARNSAARMAAAYQAQTQSYPALFEAQQQLAYANQVNQIRQQQSLQSLYGGGSGTASLEQLAAQ